MFQAPLLEELRGRVAMLEMGEPVRMVTSSRPGGKLHEVLSVPMA